MNIMSKVLICISLKELSDIVVIYFMYDFTYLMQVKFVVSVKTPDSLINNELFIYCRTGKRANVMKQLIDWSCANSGGRAAHLLS